MEHWQWSTKCKLSNYDVGNEIIYKTELLKSKLCDYNNVYILVRGNITIIRHQATQVTFGNSAPFTKCISKTDKTAIDDANLVMPMYNLIEYSLNYSKTTESLWFYSYDEATNFNADISNDNFKSFEYTAKLLRNTKADGANGILKKCNNCCDIKTFKYFLQINWNAIS